MMVLPWFDSTISTLRRVLGEDRLPHGLLVVIPEGWGRDDFLRELVRTMLDLRSVPSQLDTFAHPDFRWVQSYDEDGEPSKVIQVGAIRDLGEFVVQRVASASRKVAVLPQAHNMTINATNALLKTLEEPVSNCCLVLETSRPGQLLPTILSRCQKLPFRFRRADALQWLEESLAGKVNIGKRAEAAEGVAYAMGEALELCGGGPLHALELLTRPDANLLAVLRSAGTGPSRAKFLDQLAAAGDLPSLLDQWYRIALRKLAKGNKRSAEPLLAFADELLICRFQIESTKGVNVRLLLDRLLFVWEGYADS